MVGITFHAYNRGVLARSMSDVAKLPGTCSPLLAGKTSSGAVGVGGNSLARNIISIIGAQHV